MAAVTQEVHRGACNFVHLTHHRQQLGNLRIQNGASVCASAVSTAPLLTDFEKGETPEVRTTGRPWDCCTTKSRTSPPTCVFGPVRLRYRTARSSRPPWWQRIPGGRCFGAHSLRLRGLSVPVREFSSTGQSSEPLHRTKTGYYDVLQVAPGATQAQIKTAYYRQSFLYHPDRNAGSDEATTRFSLISEAYSVLGNKGLRKKYDRGLLSAADLNGTAKPSSKDSRDSASRTGPRRSVVDWDSRGASEFDEFFKSHYGAQLQRERDIRVRRDEMLRKKQESSDKKKLERISDIGVGLLVVLAIAFMIRLRR